ncbi:MAG: monofunctional biosynthetic peptidoglycan transglycosylase [Ottowia sp.]|nr:monofunctional biosynthetic peptidoglycan transglycosylase [Ottowia sp.]
MLANQLNPWVRLALLLVTGFMVLQLFFVGRIALTTAVNPQSTAVERSRIWLQAREGQLRWSQQWRDYADMSDALKRAVVASEDDRFMQHKGIDWPAIKRAFERNVQRRRTAAARGLGQPVVVRGGSTITQQLAKNLLLSGERTFVRKGQELVLTWALETLLSKRRILEIYLNHAEWGRGIFGAEAAAQHYFGRSASTLSSWQAARLAVMLPNPRRFEQHPGSAYLQRRANTIARRMRASQIP